MYLCQMHMNVRAKRPINPSSRGRSYWEDAKGRRDASENTLKSADRFYAVYFSPRGEQCD